MVESNTIINLTFEILNYQITVNTALLPFQQSQLFLKSV
jgi:hypothetical protein